MTPAAPLPHGTVALLFTGIEGSARLLGRLGEGYGSVLRRHCGLLAGAFAARGGVVVETQGEALFVVFDKPARLCGDGGARRGSWWRRHQALRTFGAGFLTERLRGMPGPWRSSLRFLSPGCCGGCGRRPG